MTRAEKVRLIFWLTVLTLIVGVFAIDQFLIHDVCISAQIADATSVTYYGVTCR